MCVCVGGGVKIKLVAAIRESKKLWKGVVKKQEKTNRTDQRERW